VWLNQNHSLIHPAILEMATPSPVVNTNNAARVSAATTADAPSIPFQLRPFPASAREFFRSLRWDYGQICEDPTEPFVVDGDSLLFDALEDGSIDVKHGGQFISVIYLIESLLRKLLLDHRRFDVVFFEDVGLAPWYTADTCEAASRALMRQVLIHHLRQHCSEHSPAFAKPALPDVKGIKSATEINESIPSCFPFQVLQFASVQAPEWRAYVAENDVSFVIISASSAADRDVNTTAVDVDDADAAGEADEQGRRVRSWSVCTCISMI